VLLLQPENYPTHESKHNSNKLIVDEREIKKTINRKKPKHLKICIFTFWKEKGKEKDERKTESGKISFPFCI
jgi:hypothetical protein